MKEIIVKYFKDDENIPNSSLPVLIYRNLIEGNAAESPQSYEVLFSKNGWDGSWRNGLFNFHHYHSTAHEVLGVYSGWAEVQIGGNKGEILKISTGDVVILPAGTGHKNLSQGDGLGIVGSYPKGQSPDMNYGRRDERPLADRNIKKVPFPTSDPAFGIEGGLLDYWKQE